MSIRRARARMRRWDRYARRCETVAGLDVYREVRGDQVRGRLWISPGEMRATDRYVALIRRTLFDH